MADTDDPLHIPTDDPIQKTETPNEYFDINQFLTIKQENCDEEGNVNEDVLEESQGKSEDDQISLEGNHMDGKVGTWVDMKMEDDSDSDDIPLSRQATQSKKKTGKKQKIKKVDGMYWCDLCHFKTKYLHALKIHKASHSDEKPFECNTCDYKTKYATSLRRHVIHQHEQREQNMKCDQCDYKTAFKSNLRLHMRKHYKQQCVKCTRKFDVEVIEAHRQWCGANIFVPNGNSLMPEVTESGPPDVMFMPKCELVEGEGEVKCGEGTEDDGGELQLNPLQINNEDGTTSYGCDKCDYKTAYKQACKAHMRKHINEKTFDCQLETCDYTTKHIGAIIRHRLMHISKNEIVDPDVEYFKCDLCDYKSLYKNNLKVHERKHSIDKKYQCNLCDFKTAHPTSYKKHRLMHEKKSRGEEKGTYECAKCEFKTSHRGRLDYHLLKCHSEVIEGSHQCPYCSFATKEKWRITVHKGRSRVSEPLKCLHCDFETLYKCEFRGHKKSHLDEHEAKFSNITFSRNRTPKTSLFSRNPNVNDPNLVDVVDLKWSKILVIENKNSDKPYTCYQCDYSSKHKCGVQKHYRRHHLELLPFDCEKCAFVTKTKDALQLHVRRSTVDSVLVCDCGFQTFYKCELANHQKIHNPYRCDLCPYSTKSKYDFIKHDLKHSAENRQEGNPIL